MRAMFIIELAFFLIAVVLTITQIVLPGLRGRRLFPILYRKRRQVETALAEARDDYDIDELEEERKAIAGRGIAPTPEAPPFTPEPRPGTKRNSSRKRT